MLIETDTPKCLDNFDKEDIFFSLINFSCLCPVCNVTHSAAPFVPEIKYDPIKGHSIDDFKCFNCGYIGKTKMFTLNKVMQNSIDITLSDEYKFNIASINPNFLGVNSSNEDFKNFLQKVSCKAKEMTESNPESFLDVYRDIYTFENEDDAKKFIHEVRTTFLKFPVLEQDGNTERFVYGVRTTRNRKESTWSVSFFQNSSYLNIELFN